jgi:hypothetical protein
MPFLMSPSDFGWAAPGSPSADLPRATTAGPVGAERVIGPARPAGGPVARPSRGRRAVPISRRNASER